MPDRFLDDDERLPAVDDLVFQLDDRQGAPLSLLPVGAQDPLFDFGHQAAQVLGVGPEHLVELGEFARPEENLKRAFSE